MKENNRNSGEYSHRKNLLIVGGIVGGIIFLVGEIALGTGLMRTGNVLLLQPPTESHESHESQHTVSAADRNLMIGGAVSVFVGGLALVGVGRTALSAGQKNRKLQ